MKLFTRLKWLLTGKPEKYAVRAYTCRSPIDGYDGTYMVVDNKNNHYPFSGHPVNITEGSDMEIFSSFHLSDLLDIDPDSIKEIEL